MTISYAIITAAYIVAAAILYDKSTIAFFACVASSLVMSVLMDRTHNTSPTKP